MLDNQVQSNAELVSKASEVVPTLRKHAAWSEENRRLHDETIEAMAGAGIFRLRAPLRYGGAECDARTLVDVMTELGQGDGSASWNTSVWMVSGWLACLFPDEVQDEVFSTPDVRVCGVLTPSAAAQPTNGGFTINGRWGFISGALHSHWQVILAMGPAPDGGEWPIMALVPMSDLQIVDDWYTAGLQATGSVTTVAENVFVPQERAIPMPLILQEQYASVKNAESPIYRQPMMATGCASFIGTATGLAKAAVGDFLERLPSRKITYTDYTNQNQAPLTHFQVAEATLKTDEAQFHAHRLAALLDGKGDQNEPWTLPEKVSARAALGRVFQLAQDVAGIMKNASGGSAIYRTAPIQRIERDVATLNQHALMHPDTNFELYGRVLCGVGPNTMYL